MALQYSPKIVTDSLVMCLDASQNKSYPTDLPVKGGLALWLDAADDTVFSYSSGTSVSQWRDKSGNNFHASQGTVASQPSRSTVQNSRKTVTFDGTNDTVTIPSFVSNSEMSIFVVSNCGTSLFIEHSTDTNSNNGFYLYGVGGGMFAIRRGSVISFNALSNWLTGAYSIATGTNSTGTDLLTYKNGTQTSPTATNLNAFSNSYTTNTLYIGSRGANSLWSSGPIAEIIIYNRKVTNAERNSIHTYLGQKWGISNTDRQIFDLSGNNFNFAFNGTNPRYNAKSIVSNFDTTSPYAVSSFGGQNLTSTILNLLYVDHTIEVAVNLKGFKAVKSFDNPRIYEGGAGIVLWQGYHAGLYVDSDTQKLTYLIWNSDPTNVYIEYVLPNDLKDKILYITAKRQANVLSIFINGVLVAGPTSITTTVRSYSQINIGAAFQGDPSSGGSLGAFVWAGQHEYHLLRMYSKALDTSELVSNYQAFKARFDNNIVRYGLVLDLDAGNPYSYAGSGATWYDVSGNSFNATLIKTPTYSSDNGGVLNWNGLDQYATVPMSSTLRVANITQEVWVYLSSTADQVFIGMQYGTGSSNSFALWLSGGTFYFGVNTGGTFYASSFSTPSVGVWYHLVHTYGGSSQSLYINGSLIGTYSSAATGNITYDVNNTKLAIGADFNGTGYDTGPSLFANGKMPVVRIYNTALSAAQVLQNYNATKGRFGLL